MKGNLLLGTARGKMGDLVGKVVHGKQIFAKYQPVVFNPKSNLQNINRGRFTKATESYKQLRNTLVVEGFDFRYNLYSGASKSLRNIMYNFIMQAQDLGENQGNSRKIKMISPLEVSNTIGNILIAQGGFLGDNDLFPQFVKDYTNPSVEQYFGSDVPLTSETRCFVIGTASQAPYYRVLDIVNMNIQLSQEDRSGNIGLPKNFGLYETLSEVGEWNYIYSLTNTIDEGADGFLFADDTTIIQLYYFWIDKNGRIISSGSLERMGSPVVTP